MQITSGVKLSDSEVLSLLNRFDDSSDIPLHEGLDFNFYSKKLSEHALFVLAYEGHILVGFIAYYLNEEGNFVYVPQVVVHKEGRHKGVGHAMFEHFFSIVFPQYDQVKLEVLKNNMNARSFYAREGFRQIEDLENRLLLSKSYYGD